ncbi:MAG: metallophosphoesterase [Candidatus Woesearchaeota archaeon]
MEISKGIRINGLGLVFGKALIIADVHMGYEESLNKKGILLPRKQYKETIWKLKDMLSNAEVDTIIINGDIKHEFGTISETEWRHTLQLIDFLSEKCKKLILLKGNHDTILGPIAKKRDIEVKDYHVIKDTFICHGHIIPKGFNKCKRIIIAHEHPAIAIKEDSRVEKFKCFLKGKYKGKELIVMPSLNTVTEGTDIVSEEKLSPFLQQDLSSFEVYVVEGRDLFYFGKVKSIA